MTDIQKDLLRLIRKLACFPNVMIGKYHVAERILDLLKKDGYQAPPKLVNSILFCNEGAALEAIDEQLSLFI